MKDANTMPPTVGVIGAGRMGAPIIGHLVRKGFATQACDVNRIRRAHHERMKSASVLIDVSALRVLLEPMFSRWRTLR